VIAHSMGSYLVLQHAQKPGWTALPALPGLEKNAIGRSIASSTGLKRRDRCR